MVDIFALGITHALMLYAAWIVRGRADLHQDPESTSAAEEGPQGHA